MLTIATIMWWLFSMTFWIGEENAQWKKFLVRNQSERPYTGAIARRAPTSLSLRQTNSQVCCLPCSGRFRAIRAPHVAHRRRQGDKKRVFFLFFTLRPFCMQDFLRFKNGPFSQREKKPSCYATQNGAVSSQIFLNSSLTRRPRSFLSFRVIKARGCKQRFKPDLSVLQHYFQDY